MTSGARLVFDQGHRQPPEATSAMGLADLDVVEEGEVSPNTVQLAQHDAADRLPVGLDCQRGDVRRR